MPVVFEMSNALVHVCPPSVDRAKYISGCNSPDVVSRHTTSMAPLGSTAIAGTVDTLAVLEIFKGMSRYGPYQYF